MDTISTAGRGHEAGPHGGAGLDKLLGHVALAVEERIESLLTLNSVL